MKLTPRIAVLAAFSACLLPTAKGDNEAHEAILPELSSSPHRIVSTIPANGDLNPYGVAFVPDGFQGEGSLEPGDILVSNFNNSQSQGNQQGRGTTIVKITPTTPASHPSFFFQGKAGLGLTTALGILRAGFVLVGNVPTTDGTSDTVMQGSLLVLNSSGKLIKTLTNSKLLDGPWDLAIHDEGSRAQVFVSNVLSGTVTRLDVAMEDEEDSFEMAGATQIASGYQHRTDPAALVIGPTGLAYDSERDVLYVASTGDNAIFAIPGAGKTNHDNGKGKLVYRDKINLHGPLGLVLATNGHLIASNGDAVNAGCTPNELVEFTPQGGFVTQFQVDPGAGGGAFGIAITGSGNNVRFAAVDDNTNMLHIWNVR